MTVERKTAVSDCAKTVIKLYNVPEQEEAAKLIAELCIRKIERNESLEQRLFSADSLQDNWKELRYFVMQTIIESVCQFLGSSEGQKTLRAAEIREMHENGATYDEIGKRLGISKQRANQLATANPPKKGGRRREFGLQSPKAVETIAAYASSGMNTHRAAELLGVSQSTVSLRLAAFSHQTGYDPYDADHLDELISLYVRDGLVAKDGGAYHVVTKSCMCG